MTYPTVPAKLSLPMISVVAPPSVARTPRWMDYSELYMNMLVKKLDRQAGIFAYLVVCINS